MSDVYQNLARHLDNLPAGFPATESGVEIRILKRLFTAKEAEIAVSLSMMPEKASAIAERLKMDEKELEPILKDIDLLLVMSVNPGFGGQKFIEHVLPKIAQAREMVNTVSPDVAIEVDGGITVDNIGLVANAGADVIVSGAAIFGSGDYAHTIRAMKALIGG